MNFFNEDFMLKNKTAKKLYHKFAEGLPIIDYHCHIPPEQIAEDHRFSGITELMLGGDHYKWRAMRSFGIEEKYFSSFWDAQPSTAVFPMDAHLRTVCPLWRWLSAVSSTATYRPKVGLPLRMSTATSSTLPSITRTSSRKPIYRHSVRYMRNSQSTNTANAA